MAQAAHATATRADQMHNAAAPLGVQVDMSSPGVSGGIVKSQRATALGIAPVSTGERRAWATGCAGAFLFLGQRRCWFTQPEPGEDMAGNIPRRIRKVPLLERGLHGGAYFGMVEQFDDQLGQTFRSGGRWVMSRAAPLRTKARAL